MPEFALPKATSSDTIDAVPSVSAPCLATNVIWAPTAGKEGQVTADSARVCKKTVRRYDSSNSREDREECEKRHSAGSG